LWGDTLNIAARIEQAAKPDEICVSDAARERLGVGFLCTMIGEARGAGRIAIWRLDREQKGRADI
jgi:adenylate cyclase